MKNKPLILVTNDDGISAPGIRILTEIMSKIGEVWVVAPEKARSGMGHAITIGKYPDLRRKEPRDGASREFSCSGTPADCVKLAKNRILPRRPDICVSGINHGSNATINVIYSGTMGSGDGSRRRRHTFDRFFHLRPPYGCRFRLSRTVYPCYNAQSAGTRTS